MTIDELQATLLAHRMRGQFYYSDEKMIRGLKKGDRVIYRGWRGDFGTGTVIRQNATAGVLSIVVHRDFSADTDGTQFFPVWVSTLNRVDDSYDILELATDQRAPG